MKTKLPSNSKGSVLLSTMILLLVLSFILVALHASVLTYYTRSINAQYEKQAYLAARSVVDTILAEITNPTAEKSKNRNGIAYLEEIVKFNVLVEGNEEKTDKIILSGIEFSHFFDKELDSIKGTITPTKFHADDHGEGSKVIDGSNNKNTLSRNNGKITLATGFADFSATVAPTLPQGVELAVEPATGELNLIWDNPKKHDTIQGNVTLTSLYIEEDMEPIQHRVTLPKTHVVAVPKVREIEISVTATVDGHTRTVKALVEISSDTTPEEPTTPEGPTIPVPLGNAPFYFDEFELDDDVRTLASTKDSTLIIGDEFEVDSESSLALEGLLFVKGDVEIESKKDSTLSGGLSAWGEISLENVAISGEIITPRDLSIGEGTTLSTPTTISASSLELAPKNLAQAGIFEPIIHARELKLHHSCTDSMILSGELHLNAILGGKLILEGCGDLKNCSEKTTVTSTVYSSKRTYIYPPDGPRVELTTSIPSQLEFPPFYLGPLDVFLEDSEKPKVQLAPRPDPDWAKKDAHPESDVIKTSNTTLTGDGIYTVADGLTRIRTIEIDGDKPVFIIVQNGQKLTVDCRALPNVDGKPQVHFILKGDAEIEFEARSGTTYFALYGGEHSKVSLEGKSSNPTVLTVNGSIIAGKVSVEKFKKITLHGSDFFADESPTTARKAENVINAAELELTHNTVFVEFKEYIE